MSMEMEERQMTNFPPSHDQPPAYSDGRKGGYSSLPQHDYRPPTGYSAPAPPPSSYAPAPPVFQQQQSSNNVVVVGNQPTPQPQVVHVPAPRAPTYLLLTGVLLVICFFHGNLPGIVLFLVPALICACVAQDNNNAGDYESARSCGRAALGCNILAIVYFVLLILGGIAGVCLYFFYFKAQIEDLANDINNIVPHCCSYNLYGECNGWCTD